jgi:hypothetical protein
MLLTVLATLPFLAGLSFALLTLRAVVGGNWSKIAAALRGESKLAIANSTRPVAVRFSPRPERSRQPLRAEPRWRVAA